MIRGQSEYIGATVLIVITVSATVLFMQWYISIAKASEEALNIIERAREDIHVRLVENNVVVVNRGSRTSAVDCMYLQLKNKTIAVERKETLLKPGEEIFLPVHNVNNVERVCIETKSKNVFCSLQATETQVHPSSEDQNLQKSSYISMCTVLLSRLIQSRDLIDTLKRYYIVNCSEAHLPTRLPSITVQLGFDDIVRYRVAVGSHDSGWIYVYSLPIDVEIINREFVLNDFKFGKLVAKIRIIYRFESPTITRDTRSINWIYVTAYPKIVEVKLMLVNNNSSRYLLAITNRSFSTIDYGENSMSYRCDKAPQDDNGCYLLKALVSRTGYWDPAYMGCIISRRYDLCGHEMVITSNIYGYVPHNIGCISGSNSFTVTSFTSLYQPQRKIYTNYSYIPTPTRGELTLSRFRFELDVSSSTTYLLYGSCYSAGIDRILAVYDKNGYFYYTQNCYIEAKNLVLQTISIGLWYSGDTSIYIFELNSY